MSALYTHMEHRGGEGSNARDVRRVAEMLVTILDESTDDASATIAAMALATLGCDAAEIQRLRSE